MSSDKKKKTAEKEKSTVPKKSGPEKTLKQPHKALDIIAAVDAGESILDEAMVASLSPDELKEMLMYVDPVEEPEMYARVLRFLKKAPVPRIEKARTGLRVWSFFYDKYFLRMAMVLVLILAVGMLKPLFPVTTDARTGKEVNIFPMIQMLLAVITILSWHVWLARLESGNGSTWVRRRLGIVVVDRSGKPLGFWKAFWRGWFRAFLIQMGTIISIERNPDGRGWHDRMFGTYVLRVNADTDSRELAAFIADNYR